MSSKGRTGNKRPRRGPGKHAGSAAAVPRRASARSDARKARPDALCPISDECGACPQIDVPYLLQVARKNDRIRALFEGLLDEQSEFDALLGMSEPLRFRDKIASPFAPGPVPKGAGKRAGGVQRDVLCGMYAAGTHRNLVDPLERPELAQPRYPGQDQAPCGGLCPRRRERRSEAQD